MIFWAFDPDPEAKTAIFSLFSKSYDFYDYKKRNKIFNITQNL